MASGNEPERNDVSVEKRLRLLIASLDGEELEEVLRALGGGKEREVARVMLRSISKK